ncbi:MAG: META domain-containing protein [Flavobacteriales bacterium]|nr:META domain-containing protein [Flavobacteriales bacterium]
MSYRLLLFLLVWTIVSCKSKEKVANTDTTQPSKVEVKADAKNQNTVQTNSAPVDMGNSESPKSEEMAFPGAEKLSGTWELSAWVQAGVLAKIPYQAWGVQLTFDALQNNVAIKGPCNNGGCAYSIEASSIEISENCFFTEMYCMEQDRSEWESKLVQDLSQMTSFSQGDNEMTLNGANSKMNFKRVIE